MNFFSRIRRPIDRFVQRSKIRQELDVLKWAQEIADKQRLENTINVGPVPVEAFSSRDSMEQLLPPTRSPVRSSIYSGSSLTERWLTNPATGALEYWVDIKAGSTGPLTPKLPMLTGGSKVKKRVLVRDLKEGDLKPGMIVETNFEQHLTGIVNCFHYDKRILFLTGAKKVPSGGFVDGGRCLHCASANALGSWAIDLTTGKDFWIEWEEVETMGKKKKKKGTSGDFKAGMSLDKYVDRLISAGGDELRMKWLKTYRRCVLPEEVKSMMEEALSIVLLKQVFEDWGFTEHFEKGLTNSIMIFGPPGTGKSMVSEAIAAVLGKNLLKMDTAAIQSQIPGQAERNIKKAFEDSKKTNSVLMLDECDSLLYNRDSVGMILAAEINSLLTEIERFDGVVILTTNRLGHLDPALQRRIVAKIELGLPCEKARVDIWRNLCPPKMPLEKDVNFEALAVADIAGGDIKNAILIAARRAIARGLRKVTMSEFEYGLRQVLIAKHAYDGKKPKSVQGVSGNSFGSLRKEGDAAMGASSGGLVKTIEREKIETEQEVEKVRVVQ